MCFKRILCLIEEGLAKSFVINQFDDGLISSEEMLEILDGLDEKFKNSKE